MKAALLALLLAAACGRGKPASPEARGKAVYASYGCQQCHRIGSSGGATGPDLTYVGFRKSAAFLELWLKNPSAWQPKTMMPNFHFNESSRRDLAAYLSTLRGQEDKEKPWKKPGAPSAPAALGKLVYERVGCGTCHGPAGKGGYPNNNVPGGAIPALTQSASNFSRAELIDKIGRGVPRPDKEDPRGPEPMLSMPAWRERLTAEEIGYLADYLFSLKPAKTGAEDW